MKVITTALPEVLILEPQVFGDERGFFYESFNARRFAEATGVTREFVQDNHSRSARGVLRGLHYQLQQAQGKLVRVSAGEVYDVAVDVRRSSANFGRLAFRSWRESGETGTSPRAPISMALGSRKRRSEG